MTGTRAGDTIASAERKAALRSALAHLTDRLHRAAHQAGRSPDEIELLPVTKFFPASDVAALAELGCRSFGESRDQEAAAKAGELAGILPAGVHWHMVGQIQRNKARSIVSWADAAHSVSSQRVATALGNAAAKALSEGRRSAPLRVFVQISLDGDTSRGGVDIGAREQVDALCAQVHDADGLEFVGLMAVPPLGSEPDAGYARLAAERDRVQTDYQQRLGLSAGMSGDLEAAVKHGSTCVRVGTALLGSRPLTSP
ncbi:YggS family pyridoxal phosphate-dependent enzyme [Mycolicibacterium palauense]|uniref:YggS family pyridoxal phosphate-dependent enzyme n=1 Tax=Mycolicibacterium palauense TaxID=2034511 RepID=UPI001FE4EA1C|nr:YggS family pyridoxal phosphate-dependent enzyme [Mycolicibacterium palauense]